MSNRNLSDLQFHHEVVNPDKGYHVITAENHNRSRVGRLSFTEGTGEISHVEAHPQRQGIATAMWEHARSLGHELSHSALRTDAGDAWARKVGGYIPDRDETH
jgi:hypothetical protein